MNEILNSEKHTQGKVVKCAKCLNVIISGKCYCFTQGNKYCLSCGKIKDKNNICRNRACDNYSI